MSGKYNGFINLNVETPCCVMYWRQNTYEYINGITLPDDLHRLFKFHVVRCTVYIHVVCLEALGQQHVAYHSGIYTTTPLTTN